MGALTLRCLTAIAARTDDHRARRYVSRSDFYPHGHFAHLPVV